LYGSRFEWLNAENVALGKDVVNVPAGKSLASQVSKFRAFLQCGVYARTNADVREVMETAVLAAKNNYKKSQASAAAVRDVLALDGDADAETMLSAALVAQEGLTKGPETAADAFEKIAKLWDKFRENHAETVRDVHAARPAIADDLAAMLTKFGAALSIAENEKLLRLI
jgi:hypothetical protein